MFELDETRSVGKVLEEQGDTAEIQSTSRVNYVHARWRIVEQRFLFLPGRRKLILQLGVTGEGPSWMDL